MHHPPTHSSTPILPAAVSVNDISTYLGVPVTTVRGWVQRGVLPSFRIGGRRLVRCDDLKAMIDASSSPARKA